MRWEPTKLFAGHDSEASRDACLSWVRDVAEVLGYLPPQGFGDHYSTFEHLDREVQRRLRPLLYNRPYTERILRVAGPTWFEVLLAAGLLPEGSLKGARGVRVIANDGCVCLSLGEKLIDDVLSSEGIAHAREIHYPDSGFRSDWKCGDIYIEFFGLTGNLAYDAKAQAKRGLASELGLRIVEIFPADLKDPSALRTRLLRDLADAPRVEPVAHWTAPPPFTYMTHQERVAERRRRTHGDRLAGLLAAGARRNTHLGVVEFVEDNSSGFPVPHRVEGPARYWDNGTVEWYRHGVLHRDDGGPAVTRKSPEMNEWWFEGRQYRGPGLPFEMERRPNGTVSFRLWDGDGSRRIRQTFKAGEEPPREWLDFPE